jgi:hypothetical protein
MKHTRKTKLISLACLAAMLGLAATRGNLEWTQLRSDNRRGSTAGAIGQSACGSVTNTHVGTFNSTGCLVDGGALAAVATSGSASDLSTGTLPAARLPNPSASTLGGVESIAAVSNNFLTSISTSGVPTQAQPDFTNLSGTATLAQLPATVKIHSFSATFDGGGTALAAGQTAYVTLPFACTISAYNILVDTGTATIKTWRKATGTAIPTSSDSISTSGVSISSGTAIHSTTVSDWTDTTLDANDILGINLFAVSGATVLNFVAECDQ